MSHYDDGIKYVSDQQTAYVCSCGEEFRLQSDLDDHIRQQRERAEAVDDLNTTITGIVAAEIVAETLTVDTPSVPDSTGTSIDIPSAPDSGFSGFDGGSSGGGGASGDF